MADQASASIVISAEPAVVMAVIADIPAYPQWSDGLSSAAVDAEGPDGRPARATFVLDAGILKDTYTLDYTWDGDERVEWRLVSSRALKAQDGSYELRATGGGTEVTYRLAVELAIPMIGMLKRKAEKLIVDTALKGLKKRVEG